jgi:hypothetical protein
VARKKEGRYRGRMEDVSFSALVAVALGLVAARDSSYSMVATVGQQ